MARLVESTVGVEKFGGQLLQVTAALAVSALVFLGASLLLKSEEIHSLKRLLARVLPGRQAAR